MTSTPINIRTLLTTRIPFITIALCLMAGAFHLLPDLSREMLFFDQAQMAKGNFLGLLYGQWLHADAQHLAWNVGAFALLAGLLERESRPLLIGAIAIGMLSVNAWLLSPFSELQRYCGLSGLLNTLFVFLLYRLYRRTESPWIPVLAALAVAKLAVELTLGDSLFTHITWPPYAPAHLAGMLGAIIVVTIIQHRRTGGAY